MEQRLFFAIETICPWPETFPGGRILSEKDRHATLAFLGNANISSLLDRLSAFPDPGFQIGLAGFFDAPLFLPKHHPRTAGWHVRLFEGEKLFTLFQEKLVSWLVELGFMSRTERGFLPHVTIARDPEDIAAWKKEFSILPLYLGNIHLYRSLGHSKYESLWNRCIQPPFVEKEHMADIAFTVRGTDWNSLYLHASLALAFQFPPLVSFFEEAPRIDNFSDLISGLNALISRGDAACGAPLKAVSYHGEVSAGAEGIWEWEMIVDV